MGKVLNKLFELEKYIQHLEYEIKDLKALINKRPVMVEPYSFPTPIWPSPTTAPNWPQVQPII